MKKQTTLLLWKIYVEIQVVFYGNIFYLFEKYVNIIIGDLMILKFCDDNFLFYVTHTKYFNILCYFVIFLLIALFILIQKNEFIEKVKKSKFRMFFIILFSGIFVGFLIFLFVWLLNKDTFNGCSTKYYQNVYFKTESQLNNTIKVLKQSKVIITGDSRIDQIRDNSSLNKPFNFVFVSKGGSKIDWFKNFAVKNIKKIINSNNNSYYIVANMGVNDLNNKNYNGEEIAKRYFKLYQQLAEDYPEVKIYVLSVNPIDENIINNYWSDNVRTNKKIKKFNETIKNSIEENDIKNMFYCNSNNSINFKTDDGLHYTKETNQKIVDYIVNKCISFK